MTTHAVHPEPSERREFLVDGCPRCNEHAADLGLHLDEDRFRAFWAKMIRVEYDETEAYDSGLDSFLGRKLYHLSLALRRAFGLDPRSLLTGEQAYLAERGAILATAVGLARVKLDAGDAAGAAAELADASERTHSLLRVHLIAGGADPERVDALIGVRDGG